MNDTYKACINDVIEGAQILYAGQLRKRGKAVPPDFAIEGQYRSDWTACLEVAARLWDSSRATQEQILKAERATADALTNHLHLVKEEAVVAHEKRRNEEAESERKRLEEEDDALLAPWKTGPVLREQKPLDRVAAATAG